MDEATYDRFLGLENTRVVLVGHLNLNECLRRIADILADTVRAGGSGIVLTRSDRECKIVAAYLARCVLPEKRVVHIGGAITPEGLEQRLGQRPQYEPFVLIIDAVFSWILHRLGPSFWPSSTSGFSIILLVEPPDPSQRRKYDVFRWDKARDFLKLCVPDHVAKIVLVIQTKI
jgi:hypothetical protein